MTDVTLASASKTDVKLATASKTDVTSITLATVVVCLPGGPR